MVRIALAVALPLLIGAADSGAKAVPPDSPVDGWTKKGEELKFIGKDLYGHINGGAEVFHELGFRDLIVQDYTNGTGEISLEIYRMDSPRAALGIYILQSGTETPVEEIGARNSSNLYQLSFVHDESFIQINNFSGEEAFVPVTIQLAQAILAESDTEEARGEFWTLLPEENRVKGSERFIRGQFTLQPIFTFGAGDILSLGGKIFGQVADYVDEQENIFTRILIDYGEGEGAAAAYKHLIENLDSYIEVLSSSDNDFIFRDYRKRFGRVFLAGTKMELLVNLVTEPK